MLEESNSVPTPTPVSYTHLDVYKRQEVLKGVNDIGMLTLSHRDVVRHELVQAIVRAYEKHAAAKNRR